MKLEVFEYLIAIEKYGSLNKAAKHLYMSQPNLSNILTSFENELGYSVIYRNHQGIHFTEQGKEVLLIAHNIMKEKENLMNINFDHKKISLKISIGNGDYALSPIYKMLNNQTVQDEVQITIINCSVEEALEKTYQHVIDVAYFIIPRSIENQVREFALSHHLMIRCLKDICCQINVRENHPILNNFSKERLWNYPFVDYINQRPNAYDTYQQYINPHKIIEVDHHSLRSKIVSETDAYTIGIPMSNKMKESLHIVGVPTPELTMQIYEIRRESDKDNILLNQYYQMIEQELFKL